MDSLGQIGARHSPLEGYARLLERAGADGVVRVRERPFLTMVELRIDTEDRDAFSGVEDALGVPVPRPPGSSSGAAERGVLWLGPDWWLVVGPDGAAADTVPALEKALAGSHASVVDVSAQRTTIEISGPRSREVIMTGCPIDLHPREFPVGSCAQSLFGRAPVILHRLPDGPTAPFYRVFVRASYAAYLAHWVLDAIEGLEAEP